METEDVRTDRLGLLIDQFDRAREKRVRRDRPAGRRRHDSRHFTTMPASCSNKFDLMSVIVHERGHTFGLDHVDQTLHAIATMSPKTRPCDVSKRLLSAGDLAGMKSLYAK